MITEDYVSFKTAKLLKEKGFNEPCLKEYYISSGELSSISIEAKYNTLYNQVSAPTLQMAMKWLRKIYRIHIRLINAIDESYKYEIYPREGKYISKCFTDRCYYETYEQACEAAIKYCLENLI